MDGVLCDFEKRYASLYGTISEGERRSKFRDNFSNFIDTRQFASLDPMEDFNELVNGLKQIDVPKGILSSTAYPETYDKISQQKTIWLWSQKIYWQQVFVPGKRHKYAWATPTSVIIDDTYSVIEDWRKAGGIGIHHKSAKTTLAELNCCLNKFI